MTNIATHTAYMRRALALAARGKGRVNPNPCVGCVIVKGGKVVAEGFHPYFGGPHAEIVALRKAGMRARGATMYLTLEPCTIHGKTPPCAPRVVESGVTRVFVAMPDPNPRVKGRGIRALRRAGIRVDVGLERPAAEDLNRAFSTWMTRRRPHVVLKMAETLDGKIATRTGHSRWVTSAPARHLVHRLRSLSDGVLVGARTAVVDDPALTAHGAGRNPARVILDPALSTPPRLRVYTDRLAPTVVATFGKPRPEAERRLARRGVQILRVPLKFSEKGLRAMLRDLAKHGISQLLVEGGGETAWHFLQAKAVDELYFFIAPKLTGGRGAPTSVGGPGFAKMTQAIPVYKWTVRRLGGDLLVHGHLKAA